MTPTFGQYHDPISLQEKVDVWEASCATQQRILQAISRLAALASSTLDSADLSRLEAAISQLETPQSEILDMFSPLHGHCHMHSPRPATPSTCEGDFSDACSKVSLEDSLQSTLSSMSCMARPHPLYPPPHDGAFHQDHRPVDISEVGLSLHESSSLHEQASRLQYESHGHYTAEIDVMIPQGHIEGSLVTVGYAGQLYEVAVPLNGTPGNTFRVPLLVPSNMDF